MTAHRERRFIGLFAIVMAFAISVSAPVPDADARARIDSGFGVDGIAEAKLTFGTSLAERTESVKVSKSGKIFVLGNQTMPATDRGPQTSQFVLARFGAGGSVDKGFANQGLLYGAKLAGSSKLGFGFGRALSLTAGGAPIVGGPEVPLSSGEVSGIWVRDCAILTRVSRAGKLTKSFGANGTKKQCLRKGSSGRSVGLEPRAMVPDGSGRILVAGQVLRSGRTTSPFVARFTRNGRLDRSFTGSRGTKSGQNGIVQLFGSRHRRGVANEIHSLRQGKTLVVGTLNGNVVAARLRKDGSFDPSFSGNGAFQRDLDRSSTCRCSMGIAADIDRWGRTTIVGEWSQREGSDQPRLVLLRLLHDGSLDRAFGRQGIARVPLGNDFEPTAVEIQKNGRIVISGSRSAKQVSRFALVRLNARGKLDRSFFGDGLYSPSANQLGSEATDLAIDHKGRILASGTRDQSLPVVRIIP